MEAHDDVYIFGYGSLTWRPSDDLKDCPSFLGLLEGEASDPFVRVWSQRSTDHRGSDETHPGVVCDLLKLSELRAFYSSWFGDERGPELLDAYLRRDSSSSSSSSSFAVVGRLFRLSGSAASNALADLDVREKGGYSQSLVKVSVLPSSPTLPPPPPVRAILYRGGPHSPFFWARPLLPGGASTSAYAFPHAVAVASTAIGPSGRNDAYLQKLADWLGDESPDGIRDGVAIEFARDVRHFCEEHAGNDVVFLYVVGSNQFGQLAVLRPSDSFPHPSPCLSAPPSDDLVAGGLWETFVSVPSLTPPSLASAANPPIVAHPSAVACGGGHSALLFPDGRVTLWGSDTFGQCSGKSSPVLSQSPADPPPVDCTKLYVHVCSESPFVALDLGHEHTLLRTEDGRVLAFGDDRYGQCRLPPVFAQAPSTCTAGVCDSGARVVPQNPSSCSVYAVLSLSSSGRFCTVSHYTVGTVPSSDESPLFEAATLSAGVRLSAATTTCGKTVLWGDSRLLPDATDGAVLGVLEEEDLKSRRIRTAFTAVSCGCKHVILLDSLGRVWTYGDNGRGQLGRSSEPRKVLPVEGLVNVKEIDAGWSHSIAFTERMGGDTTDVYGWGRNDCGQLGAREETVLAPVLLFDKSPSGDKLLSVKCSTEGIVTLTAGGEVWGCGWNEHGNLGTGDTEDKRGLVRMNTLGGSIKKSATRLAAGGAHAMIA